MAFITHFLKSKTIEPVVRNAAVLLLCAFLLLWCQSSRAAELTQLDVERFEDGVFVSAVVQFELTPVVEDALTKGIPMFFVAQADLYQNRWYWTDRRVTSAVRTIRLAYQPLTRRWRVNIVAGLINSSGGLRATLNQNYDSLAEAISAVQRLSRWKVAESSEIEPDVAHRLDFNFSLDLSQLPRPFQIGVAGQKDWTIAVQRDERVQLAALRPAGSTSPSQGSSAVQPASASDKPKLQTP